MKRWFCTACGSDKPQLSPEEYARLRETFDRLNKKTGRQEELFAPVLREYAAITGEPETNWVHVIVHSLGDPPIAGAWAAKHGS